MMFDLIKPFLTADFVGRIVRTGIQSASASLVTKGVIDGDNVTAIAAAAAGLASLLWTAFASKKVTEKLATPANNTIGGLR